MKAHTAREQDYTLTPLQQAILCLQEYQLSNGDEKGLMLFGRVLKEMVKE